MQDNEGAWVEHLVNSSSVILIFDSNALIIYLGLLRLKGIVHFGIKLHFQRMVHIVQVYLLFV